MLDAFSKMGQDLRFIANNQDMYFQLCKKKKQKKTKKKKKIYIYIYIYIGIELTISYLTDCPLDVFQPHVLHDILLCFFIKKFFVILNILHLLVHSFV